MIDAVRQVEQEASEHRAETGMRTMGERLIESQDPHAAPKNFQALARTRFSTPRLATNTSSFSRYAGKKSS